MDPNVLAARRDQSMTTLDRPGSASVSARLQTKDDWNRAASRLERNIKRNKSMNTTMNTAILDYLEDMYRLAGNAKLLEVKTSPDGKTILILDRTIFYPQGGGQASDMGSIQASGFHFAVQSVTYADGTVLHIGAVLEGQPPVGSDVILAVDGARRHFNSCLQSGGHLLLNAMQNAGQSLVAMKGYHFPDGPYVEFSGSIPEQEREAVLTKLQAEVDRLIGLDWPVMAKFVAPEKLREVCKNVPANVPMDKPTRVVTIDGFAQPCGGTHVKTLGALRGMKVEKIRSKKGDTRVSYSIQPSGGSNA